ncbi:MAG: Fic family protein [Gammaproteobacteria bacterium]|nr:Fic family protein [Gammaproteobacteria bacterium]MBP9729428.1 Fic family protein [Gammaproteobacteria bacterium]
MPKSTLNTELELIEKVIACYPKGVGLDILLKVNELTFSRRTLQRRMKQLIESGRLKVSGKGAGTQYQSAVSLPNSTPTTFVVSYGSFEIPITDASQSILKYVNHSLNDRKHVVYNRTFLDDYQPNKSAYLSESIKAHLRDIGQNSVDPQIVGTYGKKILSHLLVDLSWNSSRLEGNTYSLLETQRLIEWGEKSEGKSITDTQMILNHKSAIEFLVESSQDINFNRFTILNLHALLSDNLLSNAAACGRLRNIPVAIAKTSYTPLNVPQIIDECFEKILEKTAKIQDPFEQAFFVMVQLPYLQPFEDINKRVSRLAANIPLIRNHFSPLSFVDVPEKAYIDALLGVYELNRIELLRDVFIWAYERSAAQYTTARQLLGEPDPFRLQYREALIELIGTIVRRALTVKESIAYIQTWIAQQIPEADSLHFREIVETELLNLHSGNIARFRLKAVEFQHWQAHQKGSRQQEENH